MSSTEIRTLLELLTKLGESTTEVKKSIITAIENNYIAELTEQNALLAKALLAQSISIDFGSIIKISEGIGRREALLEVIESIIEIMS